MSLLKDHTVSVHSLYSPQRPLHSLSLTLRNPSPGNASGFDPDGSCMRGNSAAEPIHAGLSAGRCSGATLTLMPYALRSWTLVYVLGVCATRTRLGGWATVGETAAVEP